MTWTRRDFLRRTTIGAGLTTPLAQTLAGPHVARAQGDRHGGTLRISATFGLSTINPVAHISGGRVARHALALQQPHTAQRQP